MIELEEAPKEESWLPWEHDLAARALVEEAARRAARADLDGLQDLAAGWVRVAAALADVRDRARAHS